MELLRGNKKESFVDRLTDFVHRYALLIVFGLGIAYIAREGMTPQVLFESPAERKAFFASIEAPETRVVALVASWCGACRSLEHSLDEEGIPYTRVDIEESAEGRALYEKAVGVTGRATIPKVVVDQQLVGHRVSSIKAALADASGQKVPKAAG